MSILSGVFQDLFDTPPRLCRYPCRWDLHEFPRPTDINGYRYCYACLCWTRFGSLSKHRGEVRVAERVFLGHCDLNGYGYFHARLNGMGQNSASKFCTMDHVFLSQNAFLGGMPCTRVDRHRARHPFLRYEGGLWLRLAVQGVRGIWCNVAPFQLTATDTYAGLCWTGCGALSEHRREVLPSAQRFVTETY